jgi:predicted nucleic acid-binding protein
VILADTSIWIEHFTGSDVLEGRLNAGQIAMHPFIVAELALGPLVNRALTLKMLEALPTVRVARLEEVREMIEQRRMYSRGIGLVDAHLIASIFLAARGTLLWTLDKRLRGVAEELGIHV